MDNTNSLKMSDFDYDLPRELIAQTPIEPRDASRLLVVNRASGSLEHRHFRDIGKYLRPGDLLIANQSRVLPARLFGHRAETGGAVEILLLAERPDFGQDCWEALVRPGRRMREGMHIVFDDDASSNEESTGQRGIEMRSVSEASTVGTEMLRSAQHDRYHPERSKGSTPIGSPSLHGEILDRTEAGGRIVRFFVERHEEEPERQAGQAQDPCTLSSRQRSTSTHLPPVPTSQGAPLAAELPTVRELIERLGRMPLPPYIHETLKDPERYQTVYARISGSAAAPTAGLHFTPQLLEQLRKQGVRVGFVTLHVGLDTFRPVEVEDFSEHKMHSEVIDLDAPTAELISETRRVGGRVIAVGTTAVRVLESVASFYDGEIKPYSGSTRLFITPGYRFQIVDGMITNFHLPRSTLLLLVSAFASKALMEKAYQEAIRERYRFFSFGDAMLIV